MAVDLVRPRLAPGRTLAVGPERGDGTPRQTSDVGQVRLLAERHCHSAFSNRGDYLRRHVQVDLPWLPARPFHNLDGHTTVLRRPQDQPGDLRSMASDLAVAHGPLATAKEQDTLPVAGR